MNKQEIINIAWRFTETSDDNYTNDNHKDMISHVRMRIFENPILGFADASDPYFLDLKKLDVIGPHFLAPEEWLPESKTVISFFLPYTKIIRESNRLDKTWPSAEWLLGRYEGQIFVSRLVGHLESALQKSGFKSVAPSLNPRYETRIEEFTSNWSERHVAFIAGLGTFSLSKGLITSNGVAGRFGSIVTELKLVPTVREYSDIYGNCSFCGACVEQCPVNAISMETGKNHEICNQFLETIKKNTHPATGAANARWMFPVRR